MNADDGKRIQQEIFSGARLTTLTQAGSQATRFAVSLVLARLLSPNEFGLMAVALAVIGLIDLFKDLGTVSALIRGTEPSVELVNATFVLNITFGMVGAVAICASAPLLARTYQQPELVPILLVLSATIPISCLGLTKIALLRRHLNFGRLAAIELATTACYCGVAVVLAYLGYGVWSLVFAHVGSAAIASLLLWFSSDWRPSREVRFRELRSIASFSLNLTASQLFGYLIAQADKLIIGYFLGMEALGVYSIAQRLIQTAITLITVPIGSVLFPVLSSIQDDNPAIGRHYTRACAMIAAVNFPLLVGLGLVAQPFVSTVLGDKWQEAVPLLAILALPALAQSLAMTVGSLYLAKSRAGLLLRWQIAAGAVTTVAFLVGVRWGITGVAVAYTIAILGLTYPAFVIPFRLIRLRLRDFARPLWPVLASVAIMGAALLALDALLARWSSPAWVVLAGSVATGGIVYLIGLHLFGSGALADLRETFFPSQKGGVTTRNPCQAD